MKNSKIKFKGSVYSPFILTSYICIKLFEFNFRGKSAKKDEPDVVREFSLCILNMEIEVTEYRV